jgi:DNA invertase Pin-like site-specific DNA recombinase
MSKRKGNADLNDITDDLSDVTNNLKNINIDNNKAIIYARVSSKNQEDSLPMQVTECKEYCKENNLLIVDTETNIGSAYQNTDNLTILNYLDNYGNINLIIKDPSRLTRNINDGALLIQKCIDNKIIIHNVLENYICNTPVNLGRLLGTFMSTQQFSTDLSNKLKSGNKIRKLNGWQFGQPPFGKKTEYLFNQNNVKTRVFTNLDINHREKQIIKLILLLHNGTNNISKMLELFNSLHEFSDDLGGNKYKFKYDDEEEIVDLKDGLSLRSIKNTLNDWKIYKRGKEWTINYLENIINNN